MTGIAGIRLDLVGTDYLDLSRIRLLLLIVVCCVVTVCPASAEPAGDFVERGFVSVPAGCFQMGNGFGDGYFTELPVHEVCVSSFEMAIFPVTRGAFKEFVDDANYRTEAEKSGGCYVYDGVAWKHDRSANWRFPGFVQDDSHPVVCVSWNDSVAYASWFSKINRREYRLPTEAEWEYAARSGGKSERYAGSNDITDVAWFSGNSENTTHPVGQKRANGLGLYDMSGNVWQWTRDWYGENYYRESPRTDPIGAAVGTKRIFRGGSWFYDARGNRTSYRDFYAPNFKSSYLGFRLTSTVP